MELYKLTNTGYILDDLIEGYDSFIWTERYRSPGDFEFTTPYIEETLAALPLTSRVSLRDSTEVCLVETFEITIGADGSPALKVSGRSFDAFLEHRAAIDVVQGTTNTTTNEPYTWNLPTNNSANTAASMIRTHLDFGDVSSKDTIPGFGVSIDINTPIGAGQVRKIQRGDLHTRVLEILNEDDLGIRSERSGSNIYLIVYNGTDKSDSIIMDVAAGHFEKPSYLISNRNQKTAAYASARNRGDIVYAPGGSTLTGFDHRVLLVEADDITDSTPATPSVELNARALGLVRAKKLVTSFDGEVVETIPYIYKTDYKLGDIVTGRGEYGISQKMMITEYIRIQDQDGERAYPALSVV